MLDKICTSCNLDLSLFLSFFFLMIVNNLVFIIPSYKIELFIFSMIPNNLVFIMPSYKMELFVSSMIANNLVFIMPSY